VNLQLKNSRPTNLRSAEQDASADAMEARMRGYQSRVQAVLDAALPAADLIPQRLHAAQRYAVLGGGKRLRPLLVYCTGEALNIPVAALDAPAAAVELIHSYSLVHDDLPAMDDDDLRRGQPTTHRAFDEATAILAGDALQVLAFSLLSRDRAAGISADARLKMIQILADASGTAGMAGGQAIDLSAVGRALDLQELEAMHRLKTGALISASVLMAASCCASLSLAKWNALEGYSQDIGLAFQIQDDILDVEGKTEEIGKTSGADAARAKPTYPSVLGLEAAKVRARELKQRACERLAPLGDGAQVLAWLASYVIQRRV
jgi:geranylgeranyl pyrophosphate synthase